MKKNIIIISVIAIVAIVAVGCTFLYKGKSPNQDNNFNPQDQNQKTETATVDSLSVGNWVSVVVDKSNGSYTASMIMACDSKESCSRGKTRTGTAPSETTGNAPSGTPPSGAPTDGQSNTRAGGSMENKTMLSGTITEVSADSIVLSLDTGESATVLISDSTRINKR